MPVSTRIFTFSPEKAQELSFVLPGDGPDAPASPMFLSQDQLNEIVRMVSRSRTSTELTCPRLTFFNHQRGYIVVSTDQSYVADYTATTQRGGAVHYSPKLANIPAESVSIDIHPSVSEDHSTTDVEAHVKLSRLVRLDPATIYGHPELKFGIPREFVADVSANVRIKDGQTALFASGVDTYTNQIAFTAISPKVLERKKR
jgi:hypothetical protein